MIVSLPLRPTNTSSPGVPTSMSSPGVPMMVTGRSLQVRSLSPTVMEKSSTAGATSGSASVAVTVKVVMLASSAYR